MQVPSEVRDRFRADHERLEEIASRVLAVFDTGQPDGMRSMWSNLEVALNEHFLAEEMHAFPTLAIDRPRDAQSLLAEHRHLRARAAELALDIERGTIRPEKIRGFIDELSAHSRHEEAMLYR